MLFQQPHRIKTMILLI